MGLLLGFRGVITILFQSCHDGVLTFKIGFIAISYQCKNENNKCFQEELFSLMIIMRDEIDWHIMIMQLCIVNEIIFNDCL